MSLLSALINYLALDLRRLGRKFEPLSEGHYPILNQYPKFVVDYRKRETEKIKKREINILRQKSAEFDPLSTQQNEEQTQFANCTIITNNETEKLNFSRTRPDTDFARGIAEASRARKILLASFAT